MGTSSPLVINENFSPSTLLQVTYPNDREVTLGNTLTTDETFQAPEIFFVPPEPEASYTLIMVKKEDALHLGKIRHM